MPSRADGGAATAAAAPLSVRELHDLAAARLPRVAYDYFASGAGDERTLADNEAAWARVRLRPRCLVDVSARDVSTTVLGRPVSTPVLVAPTAFQRMAHPDGEVATAKGAAAAGASFILSTRSTTPVEEVAAARRAQRVRAARPPRHRRVAGPSGRPR